MPYSRRSFLRLIIGFCEDENMNIIFRLTLLAMTTLAGCTAIPDDLGRSDVDAMAEQRGRFSAVAESAEARDELVSRLMAEPLTAEVSVRITLLQNAELQASYARLGFAAADVYQAGRIRNPMFAASVLNPDVAGEVNQITLGLAASFTDLITLPARKRLSAAAFAVMKASIGAEVMHKAAEAESAWYGYVAAQQVEALSRQLTLAAQLSAQLAERYFSAGNINARELALERAAASEARIHSLDAAAATLAARTDLAMIMGLSSGGGWTVPGQLQLPLEHEDELQDLLALAEGSRLDLAAARTEADLLADQLGVVNWTRWLGELEVGIERERETDGARLTGPTLAWEIPIFTQNRDQQLRAEAELRIAIANVQGLRNEVDNDVRLAHADVQQARERISEYRNMLIPQRVETVARAQEELNFMLVGVFEVLALKQQEYAAYVAYLQAVQDYWQSRARLAMVTGSSLPSTQAVKNQAIDTSELLQNPPDDTDHSGMDHSKMDHSSPDRSGMDHSKMNHSDPDQSGMDDSKQQQPDHNEHDDHDGHNGNSVDDQGASS